MEQICDQLDELAVRRLELINESIGQSVELEQLLERGRENLSKTRQLLGHSTFRAVQLDERERPAELLIKIGGQCSFDLVHNYPHVEHTPDAGKPTDVDDDISGIGAYSPFGLLAPRPAKLAKQQFEEITQRIVELMNTRAELEKTNKLYLAATTEKKKCLQ